MRRQIFIHLGELSAQQESAQSQVSWAVHEPGKLPGPVFYGDLETAANHATGCRVVVFVSGFNVLMTQVNLPAMNKQRLAKAVPFALEEQVADDVDDLHFAIGQRDDSGYACAVVEKDTIEHWQQALKQANIQADVLTSECFGAPIEENSWSVLINKASSALDKALLRTGAQRGLTVDLLNLPLMVRNALDALEKQAIEAEEDDVKPVAPQRIKIILCEDSFKRQTLISSDDAEDTLVPGEEPFQDVTLPQEGSLSEFGSEKLNEQIASIRTLCEECGIELDIHNSDKPYLALLAEGFDEQSNINLLQGEFSRIEQLEKLIRPWRAAIGIAATWLLIQGGLLVAEYVQLSNHDDHLNQQLISVYKDAFPDARNVPNPKLQMERALEKLRRGGDSNVDMFTLLAKTGEVISNTESMTLRSIRYKADKLDLDLEIADLASLDELKSRLAKESKLAVEIVSASAREGKVESRLQVQLAAEG